MEKVKAISIMGFVALIAVMIVMPASAATITVCPSGCDHTSIKAAVDSASSGDMVFVYAGTYNELVVEFEKPNITLKGEGADVVTIVFDGGHGIEIAPGGFPAPWAVIEGFTITNSPCGVHVSYGDDASNSIIRNCVFEGLTGSGGVTIRAINTTFENNVVSNCTGACIYVGYTASGLSDFSTIANNTFINSTGTRVVAMRAASNCTFVNNTIINSAGDALYLYQTAAANNIITRNNISSNGGVIKLKYGPSGNKIYLNDFVDNTKNVTITGTPTPTNIWNSPEQINYTYGGSTYTNYMGNYWGSDYTGTDADGDGIGDTAYDIPGSSDKDYRPLMQPFENYPEAEAAAPAPTHEVYFEPANVSASYCETTDVGIRINSDDALLSGNAVFEYIYGCANVTGFTGNTTIWNVTCSADLTVPGKVTITFATGYPAGVGPGLVHIGNLSIHCCNDTTDCDTNLTWDTAASYLYDKAGPTLVEPVEWVNGTINCTVPAAAAAIVTSLIITPDTCITGQVSAYDIIVNTTGFKSLTVNIPAGFSAKTPSGGNQIARADLWWNNESEPYYGYVTFTANTSEPSNKVDVYADIGGLTAMYPGMAVNYSEGATASIKSPFGSHLERANLTLPTESANGSLTISGLPETITNVTVSIGAFVQNPTNVGDYTFTAKAEGEAVGKSAAVTVEAPSPCFIATAAYGTPLHEDIDVLRDFRDERLMTNPLGRTFVKTYYETSPPIADALREHEGLRTAVREGLIKPLVYVSRMFVTTDYTDYTD